MHVRHAALAATGVATFLLAGCGSSSSAKPLTLDQAKTVAAAGVLTQTDVPSGLTGKPQTEDSDDQKADAALDTCTGTTPDADKLYRDLGTEYADSDDTHEIDSSVDVVKTTAAAKADLAAITASKAVTCVKQSIASAVQGSGATVSALQVVPVSAPSGSFVYHLTATVQSQGRTASIDEYMCGSIAGQVEITVSETSYSGTAYTSGSALALLATATSRVSAALKT